MKRNPGLVAVALAAAVSGSSGQTPAAGTAPVSDTVRTMNEAAERYVRLVLALGQHDKDYVDAFYGPDEWKKDAEAQKRPLPQIRAESARARRPRRPAARRRRRDESPAPALSPQAARSADGAGRHRLRPQDVVRRGVARALRRDGSRQPGRPLPEAPRARLEAELPGKGSLIDRLRRVPQGFRHPPRQARRRLPGGDRRGARPHQEAHGAPRRRVVRRRVRARQDLERLQLVPGELQEPHPGQHGSPGLHRPRGGSRLPRGLPRPPRLQRAAREEPRPRPRLDRVRDLSALLSAVAHRGGQRELRHRRRVPRSGAARVREDGALSARRPRCVARRGATAGSGRSPRRSPTRETRPRGDT